jgi:hypothetical protein
MRPFAPREANAPEGGSRQPLPVYFFNPLDGRARQRFTEKIRTATEKPEAGSREKSNLRFFLLASGSWILAARYPAAFGEVVHFSFS